MDKMQKITIEMLPKRIVFKLGGDKFYMDSHTFLELINEDDMCIKFREVMPNKKYAEIENLRTITKLTILQKRNASHEEMSERLKIGKLTLLSWLEERGGWITEFQNEKAVEIKNISKRMLENHIL